MKNLKIYAALTIIAMMSCAYNVIAQAKGNNNVPDNVSSAFTAKYPAAQVKNWNATDEGYVSKAKENGSVFYATFDKKGNWMQTTTQIGRSRNLPSPVMASLKNSKYAAWRVDKIKKVETPTGNFYQVLVDNLNLQTDQAHMGFADNIILNFQPSGELSGTKSISSVLLF